MVLAFLALIAGGVAAWGFYQFNRIDRVDVDLVTAADLEPKNILVVGSDTRDLGDEAEAGVDSGGIFGNSNERAPGGKRADTIVIARLDPKTASVELLSVPRDLWVETASGDEQRINSAYNDGAQSLIDSIDRNLGIPINNYVEVNFNGFKGLVDAAGGVDLYFDRPVRDKNTGLYIRKPGCYTLNGVQALAFARSRNLLYSDGTKWISDQTADLGRITRQQVFLRHAMAKVSKMGLDDVNALRVLVGVAANNLTIDDTLGTNDMIKLGRQFSSFDASTMVVHRLTTTPYRTSGGADVLQVAAADSQPVLDIFSGKAPASQVTTVPTTQLAPSSVTVDVLNAAGVPGLAKASADLLAAVGFAIGEVGNTTSVPATVIRYGAGAEAHAKLLASKISPSPKVESDPALAAGAVVVKVAGELDVPGAAGAAATADEPAAVATAPTSAPTSGAGTVTPEKTLGLNIGDPPPGVVCGT